MTVKPCAVCGEATNVAINQFSYCPDHLASGVLIVVIWEALRIGAPMEVAARMAMDVYPAVREYIGRAS